MKNQRGAAVLPRSVVCLPQMTFGEGLADVLQWRFLPLRLPCAPPVAAPSEWPVGQRIFERGIPLLPRSTICRGTDLVKYAVTKGTLTMASTAWMTIDLILKQFGRKQ